MRMPIRLVCSACWPRETEGDQANATPIATMKSRRLIGSAPGYSGKHNRFWSAAHVADRQKNGRLCRDWVKRRSNPGVALSASLPTADMRRLQRRVGFVPNPEVADTSHAKKNRPKAALQFKPDDR